MKIKKNYVLNPNRVHLDNENDQTEVKPKKSTKNGQGLHSKKEICPTNIEPLQAVRPQKRKIPQLNSSNKIPKKSHSNVDIKSTETLSSDSIIAKELKKFEKHKYTDFIENWYQKFETFIIDLKDKFYNEKIWMKVCQKAGLTINDQSFNIIKSCLHSSKTNDKRNGFQIVRIEKVHKIGAHRFGTYAIGTPIVDICVEIPYAAFAQENFKHNNSYHELKTIYLSHLAVNLLKWEHVAKCHFEYLQNDLFQPVIVLKPFGSPNKSIQFIIHAIGEYSGVSSKDKYSKLVQSIRASPTSHWKNCIARDLSLLENEEFLFTRIGGQEQICHAIRLIKIWLNGQGINSTMFSGYIFTAFAVYLLEKKKLKLSMNVMDVMRVIWLNFGNSNWHQRNQGISLHLNQTNFHEFHDVFDVVFIDSTGTSNITANIFVDTYLYVKELCRKAVIQLNRKNLKFLFESSLPIYMQFDHVFCIRTSAEDSLILEKNSDFISNYNRRWYPAYVRLISQLLRKGLADRIISLVPLGCKSSTWNLCEKPIEWPDHQANLPQNETMSFGVILHPQYALDVMTKGPAANDAEAADEFKKFWGDKSEMRRFQDGTIIEACLWQIPNTSLRHKRLILKEIIHYLLKYHFNVTPNRISYIADQFDSAYTLDDIFFSINPSAVEDTEYLTSAIVRNFDEIAKNIRGLNGKNSLPLDIATILGVSSVFRYTDVHVTQAIAKEFCDNDKRIFQGYRVHEGVIQFGANAKWPNDLEAIKRVKAAIYLQMARGLRNQFELATLVKSDCIEILRDGHIFRLKIALTKELLLLKHTITSKGVTKYKDNDESLKLESELFLKPKLTTVLHTLYQKHPSYGPTVQIAKRWLYSQLIDPYLWPDECTELIVAYMYTNSGYGLDVPTQPQVAFIRLLKLLTEINWQQTFLYIHFNADDDEMDTDSIESDERFISIKKKFTENRDRFPNLCLATSIDVHHTSIWTKFAPKIEIIARVMTLSMHAFDLINSKMMKMLLKSSTSAILCPTQFFCPSMDGYGTVIIVRKCHVHTCHLHDYKRNVKRVQLLDKSVPAADFSPIHFYMRDLRRAYGDFAHFFFDPCGGYEIGVIWKPYIESVTNFSESNINGRCCDETPGEYKCNYEQLIEDFRIIGKDLVELIK